ncbi:glycosyltransferase family 2 protein [Nocardioides campestrisoli]|uniref:glycosyltransferase family 2 protein n=1 Tax=Nocardioides campestrisoli TaxID=2736757 RepID=UPI00163D9569|nr:glycosyltransferase family 2 protein [Nocardioides campestrisoli]
MKWSLLRRRGRSPEVGVVVPAYGVEQWLPEALDSLIAQQHTTWRAVVVDDGSPDRCGEIAEEYAARDSRITVLHTPNGGLGAARNAGTAALDCDYLAFLDSDDVLPANALADLVGSLEESGSDFATGSVLRWEAPPPDGAGLHEPPWMRRLHTPGRTRARVGEHPEILGDVFAWNKLFRRSFWDAQQLSWPEQVHYEDQPATTRAYLAGTFDVLQAPVYHWRIRTDGSSITQQRREVSDLVDRWATKQMALESVLAHGDPAVTRVFVDRVLPGDLWRYFLVIPGCSDAWWELLREGIGQLWGERSLVHSGLPPVHRSCGYLVERNRRADAEALITWFTSLTGPPPRTYDGLRLAIPGDVVRAASVPDSALEIAPHEQPRP